MDSKSKITIGFIISSLLIAFVGFWLAINEYYVLSLIVIPIIISFGFFYRYWVHLVE